MLVLVYILLLLAKFRPISRRTILLDYVIATAVININSYLMAPPYTKSPLVGHTNIDTSHKV